MSSPVAGKRRMDTDVIKLIESKHEVTILGGLNEFCVKFYGPRGTHYEGGVWKVNSGLFLWWIYVVICGLIFRFVSIYQNIILLSHHQLGL